MRLKLVTALFASLVLVACSGSKQVVVQQAPVVSASAESVKKSNYPVKMDSAELLRLEIAHSSYLRALALQNQGEYGLAEQFMQHAYESDPENRFLAFSVLELKEMRIMSLHIARFMLS